MIRVELKTNDGIMAVEARAEINKYGTNSYQLLDSYAGSVPRQHIGTLEFVHYMLRTWLAVRKRDGFRVVKLITSL